MKGDSGPYLEAVHTLVKPDGAWHSRKCSKCVRGSGVLRGSTSYRSDDANDEPITLIGDSVDDENVDVDHISRPVNKEVKCFQKEPLKKKDFQLNTLAEFWRDRIRKHFTHLSYIKQQVIDHQASSAPIKRDTSAAGRLLVGRRSRMNTNWAEMQLFLDANFNVTPQKIPSISPISIRKNRSSSLYAAGRALPPRTTG